MNIDTPNNDTSFTVPNLIPQTDYVVFLTAFTGAGEGNRSNNSTSSTPGGGKYF